MPFEIPTLAALIKRTAGAFRGNMRGSDAELFPNNIAVSAKVIGGGIHPAFGFVDYIAKQINVHTSEGASLEKHALDYGMARLAPTYAEGSVVMTGDPAIAIPAGLVLQRADGVRYDIVLGATTSGGGSATVGVRAQAPGRDGNAVEDVQLVLTAPLDRITSEGLVAAAGIGLGADTESDEGLRERLLFRKRNPPMSGAVHDYVAWVRLVNAGITRVFVDPINATNGRTSVGVWFMMDDTYATGIPQAADVAAVAAFIETVRPAGAVVVVAAPTAVTVAVTIDDLASSTAAVQAAVRAELASMFRRAAKVSTVTEPFTLWRSMISEAISAAVGEQHHVLTVPATDVLYAAGQVPVLGAVTFI